MEIDLFDQQNLNGFNGLHGGLTLALLLRQMRALIPEQRELITATARFVRPLTNRIMIDTDLVKNGANVTIARAIASADAGASVYAEAMYSRPFSQNTPVFSPEMPTGITDRSKAAVFAVPTQFIPIAGRMEIRPAMNRFPYTGSDVPLLCAWVCLKEKVVGNEQRIAILADALVPSYTAVLAELKIVPTVEMSVQLSSQALKAEFEWVLLRAQTTSADARGFVRETVDIWTEYGLYLATCTQTRVVR